MYSCICPLYGDTYRYVPNFPDSVTLVKVVIIYTSTYSMYVQG